jgi:hypothetical protein
VCQTYFAIREQLFKTSWIAFQICEHTFSESMNSFKPREHFLKLRDQLWYEGKHKKGFFWIQDYILIVFWTSWTLFQLREWFKYEKKHFLNTMNFLFSECRKQFFRRLWLFSNSWTYLYFLESHKFIWNLWNLISNRCEHFLKYWEHFFRTTMNNQLNQCEISLKHVNIFVHMNSFLNKHIFQTMNIYIVNSWIKEIEKNN